MILRSMILSMMMLVGASPSFAIFDAQVLVGKRWYQLKGDTDTSKISSQDVSAAVHLDPIPLVPVAFGVRATAGALTADEVKSAYALSKLDGAAVSSLGLDVLAWVPLVPVFTPYVRVTLPLQAKWAVKGDSPTTTTPSTDQPYAQTASISGAELSLGAKFSFLPLVKFSVEVNQASQKFKSDEIKINDVKVADAGKSYDLKSNSVLLGVEVGL